MVLNKKVNKEIEFKKIDLNDLIKINFSGFE